MKLLCTGLDELFDPRARGLSEGCQVKNLFWAELWPRSIQRNHFLKFNHRFILSLIRRLGRGDLRNWVLKYYLAKALEKR